MADFDIGIDVGEVFEAFGIEPAATTLEETGAMLEQVQFDEAARMDAFLSEQQGAVHRPRVEHRLRPNVAVAHDAKASVDTALPSAHELLAIFEELTQLMLEPRMQLVLLTEVWRMASDGSSSNKLAMPVVPATCLDKAVVQWDWAHVNECKPYELRLELLEPKLSHAVGQARPQEPKHKVRGRLSVDQLRAAYGRPELGGAVGRLPVQLPTELPGRVTIWSLQARPVHRVEVVWSDDPVELGGDK